eukprot:gb/GECH01014973.1/.p1 GENE.gb/GECH01014973.1/~~gb/GECH01014973.1/.p1  ORF type:complete len:399 (+),score=106.94 gb/GECH01014973.1/:1-1197(+)
MSNIQTEKNNNIMSKGDESNAGENSTSMMGDSASEFEEMESSDKENQDDKIIEKNTDEGPREHFSKDGKRLCGFNGCICTQRPMKGYSFCIKHILQDQNAPFKQCDYINQQRKRRCTNPVSLKQEDTRYCNSHKQMLGLIPKKSKPKKKQVAGKQKPENVVGKKRTRSAITAPESGSETESDVPTSDEEYAQELQLNYTLKGSEVVSEEEMLRMRRERIETLLKIYNAQFRRLQKNLRNRYLDYLNAKKSLAPQDLALRIRTDQPEQLQIKSTNIPCRKIKKHTSDGISLCAYGECKSRPVMLSEFCFQHILHDPKQRLYQACHKPSCTHPIMINTDPPFCKQHIKQKKSKKPKDSKRTVSVNKPKKDKKPNITENEQLLDLVAKAKAKTESSGKSKT